ncbi:TonB-dependent receptor [Ornithobacterium rhinotracheale]|uniref:TonB-dependent receptor n=1 Tax=Ornithobacterium rhinotracheale TaxID=28251 RepID=A0A410JP46_ORNRH|nr:TonB-dependent receptor [Ornithobacterium rhinotracheale]QAR29909.1 TonB-dependent receptor [Ornithobacterium rhinotracheale]
MPTNSRPLTPNQKALEINLNRGIYGSFAEIGAGQETVRFFYRAGGASGTLAKAMSAYDKNFSDAIYGRENDGRYVTQKRLRRMLNHEIQLLEQRLESDQRQEQCYFSYANTVTTIDYAKKYKGHGWVGLKFQVKPKGEYNEIILHVRFKENAAHLQQETLGVLGVNLIYGAFHLYQNPRKLLESLYDSLHKDQLEIDMINFSGEAFRYVDNRLMSLQLVKNGMTEAVMFGPDGINILPADVLYKKNIYALRGSFRPVTNVHIDMLNKGIEMFKNENPDICPENLEVLFEITLANLTQEGELDERDFLYRADILCQLGYNVLISNFQEYYKLINYFTEYTRNRTQIGISMGVNNLLSIFDERYYNNLSGGILEAFGRLFKRFVTLYLYPYLNEDTGELMTSENIRVAEHLKELYKYFKQNDRIKDIKDFNQAYLSIYSKEILQQIISCQTGWEQHLPGEVAELIKRDCLFGYDKDKCSFLYEN